MLQPSGTMTHLSNDLKIKRYLVRSLVVNGQACGMKLLAIDGDGHVAIEDFTRETHSTVYMNEPVRIVVEEGRLISAVPEL